MYNRTYQRVSRQGGRMRAKNTCPRPTHCDQCEVSIAEDAPVWYDRVRPILEERPHSNGGTYYHEKIGAYCTPFCMHLHRERYAARQQRSPVP